MDGSNTDIFDPHVFDPDVFDPDNSNLDGSNPDVSDLARSNPNALNSDRRSSRRRLPALLSALATLVIRLTKVLPLCGQPDGPILRTAEELS